MISRGRRGVSSAPHPDNPDLGDVAHDSQHRIAGAQGPPSGRIPGGPSAYVVRRLVELGAVPAGESEDAADTIYALCGPQVYALLVHDRGWAPDRYEDWLADRLFSALLDRSPS